MQVVQAGAYLQACVTHSPGSRHQGARLPRPAHKAERRHPAEERGFPKNFS